MPASVRVQPGAALAADGAMTGFAALRRLLTRAARAALRHEGITDAELSITLLDDDEIAALNERYLSHTGATDVIAFALYGADELPVGDIYVGWPQTLRQAQQNGVSVSEEAARVTIHGVLHVLGYDHPDGVDRLQSEMWAVQESILARVRLE